MQRLKLLGLALIAIFVLGAAVSAVASAETAGINMLPDVGEGAGIKFTVKGEGEPKLVTVGGTEVTCKKFTGSGEALSDPLGEITLKFEECKGPLGASCTGLSDTAGNITVGGAGEEVTKYHFRYLLPSPNSGVQLLVLLEHVHFSCSIVLVLVLGCVASMDLEKDNKEVLLDELVKLFLVLFLQEKGKQEITSVDNEAGNAMETCELLAMKGAEAYEKAGELAHAVIESFKKGAEAVEILLMH